MTSEAELLADTKEARWYFESNSFITFWKSYQLFEASVWLIYFVVAVVSLSWDTYTSIHLRDKATSMISTHNCTEVDSSFYSEAYLTDTSLSCDNINEGNQYYTIERSGMYYESTYLHTVNCTIDGAVFDFSIDYTTTNNLLYYYSRQVSHTQSRSTYLPTHIYIIRARACLSI